MTERNIYNLLEKFDLETPMEGVKVSPYGGGHINSTQLVTDRNGKRYIRIRLCAKEDKFAEALERIKTIFKQ